MEGHHHGSEYRQPVHRRSRNLCQCHGFPQVCFRPLPFATVCVKVNTAIFSNWHLPKIDGMDTFQGVVAHSACYPEDLDLTGKRIAVVGNGSSGIQLTTKVQPDVQHLFTWVRSPTWMTAGFSQGWAGENGANFECESIVILPRHT